MEKTGRVLATLIGVLHIYILVLEMFLWTTPRGLRAFNMTAEVAQSSATLAMNQGLYNGFLAAGLIGSAWLLSDPGARKAGLRFFLGCVLVAGVFGAATAAFKILFIQAVPALIAWVVLEIAWRRAPQGSPEPALA